MQALQGRLILMTRWCTTAQGSTVLGPHWDKCTQRGHTHTHTNFITSHDPSPAWHHVGLFSQVPGATVVINSQLVIRWLTEGLWDRLYKRTSCVLCRRTWQDIRWDEAGFGHIWAWLGSSWELDVSVLLNVRSYSTQTDMYSAPKRRTWARVTADFNEPH